MGQIHLTEKQLKEMGYAEQVRQAKLTPASTRIQSGGMRVPSGRRGDALRGVFATALQQRFPGVFQPMPDLTFDWASAAHGLGIVWGTLIHRSVHQGWVIMPLWGEDLRTSKGAFSEKKLREVLGRIEELLHGYV